MARSNPAFDPEEIARRVAAKLRGEELGAAYVNEVLDESGAVAPGVLDPAVVAPDFSDVMVGFRAWGIDKTGGYFGTEHNVRLESLNSSSVWLPREPFVATCGGQPHCRRYKNEPRLCPGETCTCGIYAAKTLAHLQTMSYHFYSEDHWKVVGPIALWGKVREGSQGWRAQKGYPQALYVPYEAWHLAEPLQEAYGVPVRLENFLKEKEAR